MKASIVVVDGHPRVATGALEGPVGSTAVRLADDVVVWIDPADPARILALDVLGSWEQSRELLAELLGSAVLAAPEPLSAHGIAGEPFELEIDLESAYWPMLRNLGFLLWLEEYSTLELDEGDLDIEVGLAASRLAQLGTAELADIRLTRAAQHLLTRVDPLLRSGRPAPRSAVEWLIVDAAIAASDAGVLELTADQRESLIRLDSAERSPVTSPARGLGSLRAPGQRRENLSLAASASDERRGSVDWRRVPRGILDSDEHTIRFSQDEGTGLLEVRVDAAVGTAVRESSLLLFEAIDPVTRSVIVAGPLRLEPDGAVYRGTARLPSDRMSGLIVEVRSVLSELEPASGTQRTRLLGMRQATRALVIERIALVLTGTADVERQLDQAADRWELAALEFSDAAEETGALDDYRAGVCRERAGLLRSGTPPGTEPLTLAEAMLSAQH